MTTVRLIYCRNHGIGSYLIRLQSWFGKWSHVGIMTPDGTVIQAITKGGVVETVLAEFIAAQSAYTVVEVDCPDPVAALAFARSQLGRKYDWTAVWGFLFARNWHETDAWECTELAEASLTAGGRSRFRAENRITPMMSFYAR